MINAAVLAIGTIKDKPVMEITKEYLKRVKPYAKVEMFELKAEAFSAGDETKAKMKEGERLLGYLEKRPGVRIILLSESGKLMDSLQFAGFLEKEDKQVMFVIAGALGFSPEVLERGFERVSLSLLTFTHEMARVILLEQIYRSTTIIKGKKYHY